ncbi:MAG: hypothetical protein HEQ34_13435 [Sphingorhabdus sp.]|uniref:hypothetical protein n=1 Tax=Sphingorhabdus sp. TaxID=1902408 RepID=UPI0025DB04C9|nr:hypothetical protein [Sphingorhabdus sp.]MCO4092937.1 hypothetical protein [Sphingorhabdus sp.]
MAFRADPENLKTFDRERGYELKIDGGGSSGEFRFIIAGPEGKYHFSAHKDWIGLPADEIEQLPLDKPKESEVWIVHNWDEHWRPIIYEAMTAYKSVHGFENPRFSYFVRFGTIEGQFDV